MRANLHAVGIIDGGDGRALPARWVQDGQERGVAAAAPLASYCHISNIETCAQFAYAQHIAATVYTKSITKSIKVHGTLGDDASAIGCNSVIHGDNRRIGDTDASRVSTQITIDALGVT